MKNKKTNKTKMDEKKRKEILYATIPHTAEV